MSVRIHHRQATNSTEVVFSTHLRCRKESTCIYFRPRPPGLRVHSVAVKGAVALLPPALSLYAFPLFHLPRLRGRETRRVWRHLPDPINLTPSVHATFELTRLKAGRLPVEITLRGTPL
jgi:hypothetical protein